MNEARGTKRRQKARHARVLICDDIENIRRLVRVFLEEDFIVCGEAVDGYDAIEKAVALKPDLIVLDLSMPRMDGIQAATKLKKLRPQPLIILFTSHEGLMQGIDPREFGVDAVVSKDRGMSGLGVSVEKLLKHNPN
jgi:DNA-binding response OmpR family regulator